MKINSYVYEILKLEGMLDIISPNYLTDEETHLQGEKRVWPDHITSMSLN